MFIDSYCFWGHYLLQVQRECTSTEVVQHRVMHHPVYSSRIKICQAPKIQTKLCQVIHRVIVT